MTQTQQPPKADFGNGHPFTGADVISSYSRAQAIEDGVLVDVTDMAKAYGFKPGVAVSTAVWSTFIKPGIEAMPEGEAAEAINKRLADLVFAVRVRIAVLEEAAKTDRVTLNHFSPSGERVEIWAHCGPGDNAEPVITIMLIGED